MPQKEFQLIMSSLRGTGALSYSHAQTHSTESLGASYRRVTRDRRSIPRAGQVTQVTWASVTVSTVSDKVGHHTCSDKLARRQGAIWVGQTGKNQSRLSLDSIQLKVCCPPTPLYCLTQGQACYLLLASPPPARPNHFLPTCNMSPPYLPLYHVDIKTDM